MGRIITYNFTQNFIQELAGHIEREFVLPGRDLSRLAIVFGGRRPALFLNRELARRVKSGFFAPKYFSVDEFMEKCVAGSGGCARISDMDACYAIYNLARTHVPAILAGRDSFSRFLPWAQEILTFIEQLDLEDIRVEALKNIQSNARIGYDVPENINALLENIIVLRSAFHEHLKQKGLYSRGFVYLEAARKGVHIKPAEVDEIIFCGFFYLHATEQRVMKYLYDAQAATLIFQGGQKEWSVLAKAGRAFGADIAPEEEGMPVARIQIGSGFDVHSEMCMAREALKDIQEKEKAVLVLPDPANIIPLLAEISSCVDEFNVSMGYPLRRSSLYSLFVSIFKAQGSKKDGRYYARDYLEALSHPLIKNLRLADNPASTRVLIHKIEEILSGMEKTSLSGSLFFTLADIEDSRELFDLAMMSMKAMDIEAGRDELKGIIRRLHTLLFSSWSPVGTFAGFAAALGGFIDELARKSPLSSYPLNIKMAQKIAAIQDECAAAAFSNEPFSQEEIFRIFEHRLEHEIISFSGSPLKGLQVLGLLETRSLNFDHVVILDVNESVLPNLQIYEPLIPREVMIGLGLNRLEKEEEIQRYQFRRLVAGAKTVNIIYQQRPDKEKSRFVEELIWQRQKEEKKLDVMPIPQARFNVKVMPRQLRIPKDAAMSDFLKALTYSASSVNTYLECPLRFYYQYVLGLREKDDVLDEVEGADIGTFIHELLEAAYKPFIGKRPVIDEAFKKSFFALLDEKFHDEFERTMKSDAFLLKEVLRVRLEEFLNNERKRNVARVFCLEQEFRGKVSAPSGVFAFKARIDRIDLLEDNSILVLDYKSGGSNILPEADPEKIAAAAVSREALKRTVHSFQLPLYLYLVDSRKEYASAATNAALYALREIGGGKDDPGLKMLLRKPEQVGRKDEIMESYIGALGALLDEIVDPGGEFCADFEDERHCAYCPFFYMCR